VNVYRISTAAAHTAQTAAPAFIAAILGGLLAAGCAIPTEIHERSDALDSPTLDRSLVTPSPDRTVQLTSTVTEFSVAAAISADPEILDELYFQWYVGYPESAVPTPPAFESFRTILFNACAFTDLLGPVGSTHTIELVISRDPAEFDSASGRVLPDEYIYVSWPVRLMVACE